MLKKCKKEAGLKRDLLSNSDKMELIGCIIDAFEDFLDEKGIVIENPDHTDDDGEANIYGLDYDLLSDKIENILISGGLLNPMCAANGMECIQCVENCECYC